MYKFNLEIFQGTGHDTASGKDTYFVIDDTLIEKPGKKMENVSYAVP